jgi:hypothetical protein
MAGEMKKPLAWGRGRVTTGRKLSWIPQLYCPARAIVKRPLGSEAIA